MSAPERSGDAALKVAVLIVTHDSAADLPDCLAAVAAQSHRPLELVVVDCASRDDSAAVASRGALAHGLPHRVIPLPDNRGFAGGSNAALAATKAPYALSLNADARPAADYVERLLATLEAHPRAGAATGRLHRPPAPADPDPADPDPADPAPADPDRPRRLDACGMRLTWSWRHLDRGSGEVDRGQYARPERVFGATGAATLYRRTALDDCALEPWPGEDEAGEDDAGEVDGSVEDRPAAIFDPVFHSFREDAELCFRLAERGWQVLYQPAAEAEHRRSNTPGRRAAMPAHVNYHSLKNRYLLRAYHQTAGNLLLTALPTFTRDLLALAYVLLRERTSLPAYRWLWRHRRQIRTRRQAIQRRRTEPGWAVTRWLFRQGERLER